MMTPRDELAAGAATDMDGPSTSRSYVGFGQLPASSRTQPVRGRADLRPVDSTHGVKPVDGQGVVTAPSAFERQQLVAEQMSEHLSVPQHANAIWRQRGMPGKQDCADGGSGKIKAVQTFDYGLGGAYAGRADLGHDPGDQQLSVDYLHEQGPTTDAYSRYVGASELLAQPRHTASWPAAVTSQFTTVDPATDVIGNVSNNKPKK